MIGDHVSFHIFKIHFNSKNVVIDYVNFKENKISCILFKISWIFIKHTLLLSITK